MLHCRPILLSHIWLYCICYIVSYLFQSCEMKRTYNTHIFFYLSTYFRKKLLWQPNYNNMPFRRLDSYLRLHRIHQGYLHAFLSNPDCLAVLRFAAEGDILVVQRFHTLRRVNYVHCLMQLLEQWFNKNTVTWETA